MDRDKELDAIRTTLRNIKDEFVLTHSMADVFLASATAMLVDLESTTIITSTPRADQLFGYLPGELEGKQVADLMPDRFRELHIGHVSTYRQNPTTRSMGKKDQALTGLTKQGDELVLFIELYPYVVSHRRCVVVNIFRIPESGFSLPSS